MSPHAVPAEFRIGQASLQESMSGKAKTMKGALTFRYAVLADFEGVLDLASQLAAQIEERAPALTAIQFEKYYLDSHAPMRLLLAVHDDEIVGMISWTLTHELYSAGVRVYISDVAVDYAARGQGVGTALIDQVKAWACSRNATKLGWEVWRRNYAAKSFYERLGASVDDEAIPYILAVKDEERDG